MATYRSIQVCIWSDRDFELYTPDQKLLFLFLVTNPLTRESGIYQATLKTISDNTGIPRKGLPTLLNGLKNISYDYVSEIVFIKNFHKLNGQGGSSENIKRSILIDIKKYNTPFWYEFLNTYPEIGEEIKTAITNTISNTNSISNSIEGLGNPCPTVGKVVEPKSLKDKYLDFVLLSKNEYKTLSDRFSDITDRIQRLNNYIGSTGKTYKSHYHTILSWANKEKPTEGIAKL